MCDNESVTSQRVEGEGEEEAEMEEAGMARKAVRTAFVLEYGNESWPAGAKKIVFKMLKSKGLPSISTRSSTDPHLHWKPHR